MGLATGDRHKPYFMLEGYAKIAGYSMDQIAEYLEIARRTLDNKVFGRTDFSLSEATKLKKLLGRTVEDIFLQE
jgi:DNA-binding XRE family transcriptional regulator